MLKRKLVRTFSALLVVCGALYRPAITSAAESASQALEESAMGITEYLLLRCDTCDPDKIRVLESTIRLPSSNSRVAVSLRMALRLYRPLYRGPEDYESSAAAQKVAIDHLGLVRPPPLGQ